MSSPKRGSATARVPQSARAAGHGGVGYLLDSLEAVTRGKPVIHTTARLRTGGRDTYRIDYLSHRGLNNPKTIAATRSFVDDLLGRSR